MLNIYQPIYNFRDKLELSLSLPLEDDLVEITNITRARFGFKKSINKKIKQCSEYLCGQKPINSVGRILYACYENGDQIPHNCLSEEAKNILLKVRASLSMCEFHACDLMTKTDEEIKPSMFKMWLEENTNNVIDFQKAKEILLRRKSTNI